MIKMIAFDLDGTISDTIPMCIEAFRKAVSPYAGHELTTEEIVQTFGLNEIGMIKAVVSEDWELALNDFYSAYEKMHYTCSTPFPQINELINYLKEQNISVALITGKGERSCNITIKKLGMERVFDEVMVGSEKHNNKAEAILELLRKYQVKESEFYYIGDTVSDINACKDAGVVCLSAAWADSTDTAQLREMNEQFIFEDVSALKNFISNKLCE